MTTQQAPIAKFLIVFAAFVIVVSGLKMASSLVVPFLLAVFIAMIVSPLLAWLKSRRVPGGIAHSVDYFVDFIHWASIGCGDWRFGG
jgi:predicted PurR-regulated permease PerM